MRHDRRTVHGAAPTTVGTHDEVLGSRGGVLAVGGATSVYPTDVLPVLEDAVEFTLGETHACALKPDGSGLCWGRNERAGGSSITFRSPARSVW